VKLFLNRGARPYLAGVAAGVLLVAGCSGGGSVPSSGAGSGLAPSSQTAAGLSVSGTAPEGFVPDACTNPKILKVCVKPGGSGKLGIKLTCKKSSVSVPCGTVHWSTKMSHAGLKGTFKPDPGNPTVETVTATRSTPKGHYSQTISYKCSAFKKCKGSGKGAVWVI
jgi:hypothetical protein